MVAPLTRVLRMASFVVCLVVIASFVLFVANQTGTASAHQQEVVNSVAAAPNNPTSAPAPKSTHISAVHEAIDEASNAFTSPFSGITAGSSSQWTIHGANLVLALVVYGFGLGFLARLIRVRV